MNTGKEYRVGNFTAIKAVNIINGVYDSNEDVVKRLKKDTLADVEKLLEKRHEEFNNEEKELALGMFMFNNELKTEALKQTKDTHCNVSWNEFQEIVKSLGFKKDHSFKFRAEDYDFEDEAAFFLNEEKGLIIFAESYMGKRVNSAKMYGEVKFAKEIEYEEVKDSFGELEKRTIMTPELRKAYDALSECSTSGSIAEVCSFDYDCREGVVNKYNQLCEALEFNKQWTEKPFLWFLTYADTKGEYDYKKISNERIKKCSDALKNVFGLLEM